MSKGDQQLDILAKYIEAVSKKMFMGAKRIPKEKKNYITLIILTGLSIGLFLLRKNLIILLPENLARLKFIFYISPIMPFLFIYSLGVGHQDLIETYNMKFEGIGFSGKNKVHPKFLSQEKEGKKIIYAFYCESINLQEWKKNYLHLETALDCNIVKIESAKTTKQVIKVHTVPTDQGLEDYLPWDDEHIQEDDFVLTIGLAMLEYVCFDFNKLPHALIAGVTGSGKSVILRCMLWQSVVKGAKIYMFDFKGGVEFGLEYEQFGEVVTERQRAIEVLKELTAENALRLKKFRAANVKNLAEYNEKFPDEPLCRIMVFCDEVAEMLDKTGAGKTEKSVVEEIEKEMSTLARLSRAPGINMILGTQRPDAKVITGQIKNNLPIRVSGRMSDPQASEMVLGNTKARDLPETKGRFLYNVGADTFEFQAFFFNDTIVKGDYQKGDMLIHLNTKKQEVKWEDETVSDSRTVHNDMEDDFEETPIPWSELGEEDEETYEGF